MWLSGPPAPQHTDSHPCTRPPSWGTRVSSPYCHLWSVLSHVERLGCHMSVLSHVERTVIMSGFFRVLSVWAVAPHARTRVVSSRFTRSSQLCTMLIFCCLVTASSYRIRFLKIGGVGSCCFSLVRSRLALWRRS